MTDTVATDILHTITKLEPAAPVPPKLRPVALRFSNVVKEFRDGTGDRVRPLDGIDLTIARGEFVAVLGPAGCGKSTILRLAAGLDEPTSGTVAFGQEAPAQVARRHGLGVVLQDHALRPWATVAANVATPFARSGRRVDRTRVAELLDQTGLGAVARTRARRLGDDLRPRVAIARALALDPEMLLLDDPFGALDGEVRHGLANELCALWAGRRVSTLLATRTVDDAVFLADRVVVIGGRTGRVEAVRRIDFGRPRLPELRESSTFRRVVDELGEVVRDTADGAVVDLR